MTDDRKGRDAPDEKNLGRSPEDKAIGRNLIPETTAARVNRENRERAEKREGKEGEEPVEYGPDGCLHVMEEEMKAAALDRDVGPENAPPAKPSVVHIMELQMKGEAIGDYVESQPGPDNTLPEEPLPGKPPEPPLGGSSRSGNDRAKATQYPASSDRRGRR